MDQEKLEIFKQKLIGEKQLLLTELEQSACYSRKARPSGLALNKVGG